MNKTIKNVLYGIFSLFIFSSSFSTLGAFTDIPPESGYLPAVTYYEKEGIIQGKQGNFYPDALVRRAEFLKILIGNTHETEDVSFIRIPYADVSENAWYAPFVKEALKKGIISGQETMLNPQGYMTWLEGIQYVYRSYQDIILPTEGTKVFGFNDLPSSLHPSLYPQIEQALVDGILVPLSERQIGLGRLLTRKEAVQMLYQAQQLYTSSYRSSPLFSTVSPQLQELYVYIYQKLHDGFLYQDMVKDDVLTYGAIEGMVKSLKDPYSSFFPPEEAQTFLQSMQGNIEGIGAQVELVNGQVKVVAPIKHTPAEQAGILAGDVIVSIDGVSAGDMTLFEAVSKIRGKSGTTVVLEIQRTGEPALLKMSIVRAKISIVSVEYKEYPSNIAYFSINQFLPTTAVEFEHVYENNLSGLPRALILDLRNNPGGHLDATIEFLGNFLETGQIVLQEKSLGQTASVISSGGGKFRGLPVVVLINKGSASASEIVAAALQDYKIATIVGETSFGKGVVQRVYEFNDNSSLKLTMAEWLSPLGVSINKKGVVPDITVVNDPKNKDTDAQLDKALELLR